MCISVLGPLYRALAHVLWQNDFVVAPGGLLVD